VLVSYRIQKLPAGMSRYPIDYTRLESHSLGRKLAHSNVIFSSPPQCRISAIPNLSMNGSFGGCFLAGTGEKLTLDYDQTISLPMENFSSSGAARIAVLTTDESIKLAAQETLASDFHTTLLDAVEGLLGLQNDVPLEGVIIDLDLDRPAGADSMLEVVSQLRTHDEDIVLIGITRPLGKAVRHKLLARGLARCFETPVDFDEVNNFLHGALDQRRRDIEARNIREEALSRYSFGELIGGSEAMHLVYEAISRVARGNTTVMIRGESGTGKELVARALVANSTRSDEAFVSVNCAALPEALIESELFGHEKGAFTGAHESRAGHIELADGGTVFLDEIGTLGLALQSKLLRVLEQHTVQRLGGKMPRKIDFRLITATNEDLEQAVHAGKFREDLYYRINVVPIHLPPLREREGDIALLVDHFLRFYCAANSLPTKTIDTDALEVLEDYGWPGNVRELENLMQRLVLMVPGQVISVKHLPQGILYTSSVKQESLLIPGEGISFDDEMARIEMAYLQAALRRTDGRKAAAAELLRVNGQRMKYLCRKYGLQG
jgi:DNA-binding NtrC family response regulator